VKAPVDPLGPGPYEIYLHSSGAIEEGWTEGPIVVTHMGEFKQADGLRVSPVVVGNVEAEDRLPAGRSAVLLAGAEPRDQPHRSELDLGELGAELANLSRTPDRRADPVVRDRRHHEESSLG
jgi:hypothetical protein